MQKYRKLGALLLAFVLIFATLVPSVSAEFSDLASGHRYYDAINELSTMGIINGFEDGTFKPEETVTRAQFAKIITYALGVGDVAISGTNTGFTDVAPEHWAAGNIKTAYDMGIINGMGDGTFLPENPVTYEQAVKMAVSAIGYGSVAMNKGGYPDGYMQVGSSVGFTKGIADGEMGVAAKRGLIAKLVYNTMGINILKSDGSVSNGDTLSSSVHKSDSVKGQVIAMFGTSLDNISHEGLNKYQIVISTSGGDETFSIEDLKDSIKNSISDYLGKLVTVYYVEEAGQDVYNLSNLVLQQNKNNVLEITDDIIDNYTNTEVEYYDEKADKTKSFSVASDAYIMYNGKATTLDFEDVTATLLANGGTLKLLDTTGGNEADVVFVQTYENYYVNSIDAKNYKIYDKYITSKSITLDPTNKSIKIEFKQNGVAKTFTDIKKDDIVSVAKSEDGKIITALISSNSTRGVVTETYSKEEGKIEINDKIYKISPSYQAYMDANSTEQLALETSATFRIDALGKLAAATIDAAKSYTYGYLVEAQDTSSSGESSVSAKIYPIGTNSKLTSSIFKFASSTKYNGNTVKTNNSDNIIKFLDDLKEDAKGVATGESTATHTDFAQIVKYTLNSSNQIDKILTNTSTSDAANTLKVTNNLIKDEVTKKEVTKEYVYTLSGSTGDFDGKYITDSTTKIIKIPDDRYDDEYKKPSLVNKKKYRAQFVDVNDANKAAVVLIYGYSTTNDNDMADSVRPVIVSEIKQTTNSNNEQVRAITVTKMDSSTATYYEDPNGDISLADIVVGDIIRLTADGSNYVDELVKVLKPTELKAIDEKYGANKEFRNFVGTALRMEEDSLVAVSSFTDLFKYGEDGKKVVGASDNEQSYTITNAKVFVIDLNKTKVESTMKGEIIPEKIQPGSASRIYVYSIYSTVELIVIFKNYTPVG